MKFQFPWFSSSYYEFGFELRLDQSRAGTTQKRNETRDSLYQDFKDLVALMLNFDLLPKDKIGSDICFALSS